MKKEPPPITGSPYLSVVMLAGAARDQDREALHALGDQDCDPGLLEIVVFDTADPSLPPVETPGPFPVRYIRHPGPGTWMEIRLLAAEHTSGNVVAFIENHCIPRADWARELAEFHRSGEWVAAGYAFTNGSRDNWWSRAALAADYGHYLHPLREGPSRHLPGNNISYAKSFLDSHREIFIRSCGADFNVHEFIASKNLPMGIAAKAITAHRCYPGVLQLAVANFHYVRLLASGRSASEQWPLSVRFLRGVLAPWLVPPLQVIRLARTSWSHPDKRRVFLQSLPVICITAFAAALGEAAGLLCGPGNSGTRFAHWELDIARI